MFVLDWDHGVKKGLNVMYLGSEFNLDDTDHFFLRQMERLEWVESSGGFRTCGYINTSMTVSAQLVYRLKRWSSKKLYLLEISWAYSDPLVFECLSTWIMNDVFSALHGSVLVRFSQIVALSPKQFTIKWKQARKSITSHKWFDLTVCFS